MTPLQQYLVIAGIIIFIGLLIFLAWYLNKRQKKVKKELIESIPEEIINDFNKAEEIYQNNMQTMTPQEILLKIWKDKNESPQNLTPSIPIEIKEEPKKKINLKRLFRK